MKTLIKREFVYFYLKSPMVFILSGFLLLVIVPPIFCSILYSGIFEGIILMVSEQLLPVMIILIIGIPFLSMQFYKEKIERNIEVLLGIGFTPFQVWLCKIISIMIAIYFLYSIGVIFSFILSMFISPSNTMYNGNLIFYLDIFLFSPILGFSVLGILGILYLVLRDVRIINVTVMLFVILFSMLLPRIPNVIPIVRIFTSHFSIISILFSIFLIFLCWFILKVVPPEKYI